MSIKLYGVIFFSFYYFGPILIMYKNHKYVVSENGYLRISDHQIVKS